MIGQFNKRITFEKQIKTDDGGGGFSVSWEELENVPEVYANISPLSSKEIFSYLKREVKVSHKIIIRYRNDISVEMRVVSGDKIYGIKAIKDLQGLNRYLEITADEEG